MNLDIMSLMAASAAVAESKPGQATGGKDPATGADLPIDSESFLSILQGLTDTSQNTSDDAALAQLVASAERAADITPDAELADQAALLASPALVDVESAGAALPSSGSLLPLSTATDSNPQPAADASTITDRALPSAALTADTTLPVGAQNAQSAAAPAGWFSLRELGTAPIKGNGEGRPALAAALAPAPTATSPESERSLRLATGDIPEPLTPSLLKSEPTLKTLSDQMVSMAAQSGAQKLIAPSSDSTTPDAPRVAIAAPSAPATTAGAVASALPEPLSAAININQSGWDKAMGQRLVFMAANGINSAELRLDPPQLGTIHVKLSMQGDQAQVLLQAAHPLARDAMETALPRLRDMLGAEGLQLASVDVGERDADQRHDFDREQTDESSLAPVSDEPVQDETGVMTVETLTTRPGGISEVV